MKRVFYSKLAWGGIRKNRKTYLPYILTCIGMVTMFYLVSFLSKSPAISAIRGGELLQSMLGLGTGIIGTFALIFLFYTNSFLMKRRKKELGLYNILGMGKWNISRILIWESVMITAISLLSGLVVGILASKLAELCIVNILMGKITFTFAVDAGAILQTVILFVVIFFLILLNSLRQIHVSNPVELLRGGNTGEKPPKANWLLALLGAVILGAAYWIALSVKDPIEAMAWFFVAVIMVIVSTYLLFIAGSVAVCRLLQKKKKYYYKTNHFVSVSSMAYRMKRNGAGLASICILSTMVLVMMSATVCLYMGTEESLRVRYPRNINFDTAMSTLDGFDSDKVRTVKEVVNKVTAENSCQPENLLDYRVAGFAGYLEDGRVRSEQKMQDFSTLNNVWQFFIIPLEDYNRLMGENVSLASGEALIYTTKSTYEQDTVTIGDTASLKIVGHAPDFVSNGVDTMQITPSMFLFVPDFDSYVEQLLPLQDIRGNQLVQMHWFYGFDLKEDDRTQIVLLDQLRAALKEASLSQKDAQFSVSLEGVAKERSGFYALNGGLFFLGVLLGVVFLFAAVLIMYYKQITEGYEDQSRFEIMQKVGMTQKEIKKSINSQVLTVFFLPLLTAGLHLAFAFPMIIKLLSLFGMMNQNFLILVTIGCFLLFALFYVLVYRITSRFYYHIVSSGEKQTA